MCSECQSTRVHWDSAFFLSLTTAAFLTPSQLSTAECPSRRKSQHRRYGLCFQGFFFLLLTWDRCPSPALWNYLTWKDKGERAKSAEYILRGNVLGEGLENSWGAGVNREWEGREMTQGETWEERQSRAVGVEESSWLL